MAAGYDGSNDSKRSARARVGHINNDYGGDGQLAMQSSQVEPKYEGTAADQRDMHELGRVQELRRNFKFMSVLGFGCTLIGTWNFFLGLIAFGLTDGGTAGLIYGFIICLTGFSDGFDGTYLWQTISLVQSSLLLGHSPPRQPFDLLRHSEAFTDGPIPHLRVSEFAPRACQKYLSYISGTLRISSSPALADQDIQDIWSLSDGKVRSAYPRDSFWRIPMILRRTFTDPGTDHRKICSTAYLAGTIIQGLIILNHATYTPQPYQGTLLVWAVMLFCVIFNVFLAKRLPFVEGVLLIIYVVGFFVIIIPLWVLAPRSPASEVFTTFNNEGGWSSKGVAVLVGLGGIVPSLAGYDCAVHMAEEIKDSSKTLPQAIVLGVAVNGVMGLIMVITICFTLGDTDSILSTPTNYPFIQVFFNATNSYAATNTMTAIIVIVFTSAVISEIATSSRQLWSFARDGGLPCSRWVAKISPSANIPLNAIAVSLAIVVLVSLINLGSTVALNAINSVTISALMASYLLTIGCLLYRRLSGRPLPARRWSLGRAGLPINVASLVFLLPLFLFAFFPLATPVTPSSMNWGVVMFGGVVVGATLFYAVEGRKTYTAPVALLQREHYEI
ncbi:hypothetical protein LTR53_001583 [Teratosphaeriaceae sp. CCFEE 6253]|nr:hypothetical protein LTR53_001583 [Teratosphaeriaceae sp. CCFEE 6253]